MGFLYFIAAWLVVLLGFRLGGVLIMTTDPASAVIVLGGMLTLLFASWSFKDITEAVGFVLSRQTSIPIRKYNKLSAIYAAAGDYALYCGLLGTYIGAVLILRTLSDSATLGPKLAVASVTILYGLIFKLGAVLARHKLKLCQLTEDPYPFKARNQPLALVVGTLLFIVILLLGIYSGGSFGGFVDPPSLVIILGGSLFLSMLFISLGDCWATTKNTLFTDEVSPAQALKAMRIFNLYHDIVVALVLVASTAGLIGTVQTLNEPSRIGPYLAMCLLPFCYGLVMLALTRAESCCMQRKMAELNLKMDSRPVLGAGFVTLIGLACYLLVAVSLIYTVNQ